MDARTEHETAPRCSFCHKTQDAVAKMIASPIPVPSGYPRSYICCECVAVCNLFIKEPGRVAEIIDRHSASLANRIIGASTANSTNSAIEVQKGAIQ
jgi:ATP-dependent protease Clp ATPase subunit